jgi:hypothetical protein
MPKRHTVITSIKLIVAKNNNIISPENSKQPINFGFNWLLPVKPINLGFGWLLPTHFSNIKAIAD